MAPILKCLCLLLICGSIFVNVDTKYTKPSKPVHSAKPKPAPRPVHHTGPTHPVHETIQKPERHRDVHVTQPQRTGNHGGTVTKAPPARTGYNPFPQAPKAPIQQPTYPNHGGLSGGSNKPQAPTYPSNGGLSGGGTDTINKQTSSQLSSYPGGSALSGDTHNPNSKPTKPQAPVYPSNGGLSGGGTDSINKQPSSQLSSYPGGSALSGGTHNPNSKPTKPQAPVYPSNGGLSGGGTDSINKQPSSQSSSYPGGSALSGGAHSPISKPTTPQAPAYPNNGGLSGGGTNSIDKHTSPQLSSYPGNGGLSGGRADNSNKLTTPQGSLYPGGNGLSGSGANNVNKQIPPQGTFYPDSGGLSGGGTKNISKPTSPQAASYPSSGGLSGGGTKNITQQTAPQATSYPASGGLSGGGINHINQQTAPQGTLYPSNGGLSGRRTHNVNHNPVSGGGQTQATGSQPHRYPHTDGVSGGGYKPNQHNTPPPSTHVIHTHTFVQPSYSHIHIRNHPTNNNYHNTIATTHIHHYHYKPPTHIYYTDNGMHYQYPVYRKELPQYVYEYRSSRSRFNVLLTGLALYNLGHVSKDAQSRNFHNNYKPGPYEVCKFGVKYNPNNYDEVDIDCRLITDFIWTVKTTRLNHRQVLLSDGTLFGSQLEQKLKPNVTQVLYPNGTLSRLLWNPSYDVIVDALDPRFNGEPVTVKDGMLCYMHYLDGNFYANLKTKYVNCKVLQQYVKKSFNSARKTAASLLVILITAVLAIIH